MGTKKRRPSRSEKEKLDNKDVPLLPLKRAEREFKAGNAEAADEAWNFVKHGKRRPQDDKK